MATSSPAIAASGSGWIPLGSGGIAARLSPPAMVVAPSSGRNLAADRDTPARICSIARHQTKLLAVYSWVAVPDRAWDTVLATQAQLAARSQHQGLSVADYLVVATAVHHQLVILHEDAGFSAAAAVVPAILQQRILSTN
jgi:hypothetical protein